MKSFGFETGTVAGNEKPMANLIAQQLDSAERWEFALESRVCRVRALRQNEPNAIILWRSGMVPEHEHDPIPDIDREPGEHPAHLGI